MQAGEIRLGALLATGHVFVVPHFQRPYVWKPAENWQPLWDDVRTAAQGVEAELVAIEVDAEPPTYFLGAVVTQQRRAQPQRLSSMNVIDGQQRLTTLQVLLASARAVALNRGLEAVANRLESLLENNPKAVHEKHPLDRYKLLPLPQDRDAFYAATQRSGTIPAATEEHRLVEARRWFEGVIDAWAGEAADAGDRLDALHTALDKRIQLVHITLDVRDDPQVIFEALNHRGVRLNPADLIKNLLFQTVEQQGEHARADELLTTSWLPFDGSPWRDAVTSGRITRARVDAFLAHWLTMRSGAEVSVEHLFASFKKWLRRSGSNAGDVIVELRRYGDVYLDLIAGPTSTSTGRLVDSMQATSTNTPWPVLLRLHGSGDVPGEQREIAAAAIDSYLMRRAICGMTSKDYNNLMRALLSEVEAAEPGDAGVAVVAKLASETTTSRAWPSDAQFRRGLLAAELYRRLIRSRLRALLVGLENHLTTGKTESVAPRRAFGSDLTIEHLLPQKWREHWPVDPSDPVAEDVRDDVVHRLGNLTLLTATLNPTVSNRVWSDKRAEIQKHSLLRLTTSSVLTSPPGDPRSDQEWASAWDEERIGIRGDWLAAEALAVWPRPSGGPEDIAGDVAQTRQGRGPSDVTLADLVEAGVLSVGDVLVWSRPRSGEVHRCVLLADGQMRHPDGQVSATPSGASALVTGGGSFDGWECWRAPRQGDALIDELRDVVRDAREQALRGPDSSPGGPTSVAPNLDASSSEATALALSREV